MVKYEELANPDSCLNKALETEMLFVLLARDPEAPDTVRDWVRRRIAHGHNQPDDQKMINALLVADAMEEQVANGRVPDKRKKISEKS